MEARGAGLSPSLAASFSKLPTPGADVQPPAASSRAPVFSVYTGHSSLAGTPGAQGGWATWAPGPDGAVKQPRPGPRRLRILNTRAHAGKSVRQRSRKALPQLFIHSSKGEVPFAREPPSRDPRGLQGGQVRHDPPPIRPQAPRRLHPHTQPNSLALRQDPQRRPRAGAATPAPHSFAAPRPPLPAAAPCRARLAAPGQAGDAAAGKRRQLSSRAASGAAAGRREGAGGGRRGGWRRERRAKVEVAPGRAAPPFPPRPAPAVPHPGIRSHRRWRLGSPSPHLLRPERPRDCSRGLGARVEERVADAHLPAPGRVWKLPLSARGTRAHSRGIPALPVSARSHRESTGLSVGPSVLRLKLPERGGARLRDSDSWGRSYGQPARTCPAVCAPRRPPAVRSATTPSSGPLSPSSGGSLSRQGGGVRAPAPPPGSPSRGIPGAQGARSAARTGGEETLPRWGPRQPRGDWAEGRRAQTCLGSARSQVHCLPGPPPPPPPRRERRGE